MNRLKSVLKRVPWLQRLADVWKHRPGGARRSLLHRMPKASICAEVGVDRGAFSELILRIVRPQTLHLIDPWKSLSSEAYRRARYGARRSGGQQAMERRYEAVLARFEKQIEEARVVVHRAFSVDAAERFENESLDWVYIDGDHLYEAITADLHAFLPKVKRGGYIAGDDYGEPGWWEDGVTRAVDEFVSEERMELVAVEGTQFLLHRTES